MAGARYSDEKRLEAIVLAKQIGVAPAGKALGIDRKSIRAWMVKPPTGIPKEPVDVARHLGAAQHLLDPNTGHNDVVASMLADMLAMRAQAEADSSWTAVARMSADIRKLVAEHRPPPLEEGDDDLFDEEQVIADILSLPENIIEAAFQRWKGVQ